MKTHNLRFPHRRQQGTQTRTGILLAGRRKQTDHHRIGISVQPGGSPQTMEKTTRFQPEK